MTELLLSSGSESFVVKLLKSVPEAWGVRLKSTLSGLGKQILR